MITLKRVDINRNTCLINEKDYLVVTRDSKFVGKPKELSGTVYFDDIKNFVCYGVNDLEELYEIGEK